MKSRKELAVEESRKILDHAKKVGIPLHPKKASKKAK